MSKGRLEAFSDGVIAILITIMVLDLKVPAGNSLASLRPLVPLLLAYILSFIYIGIYWNNHHHMLQVASRVNGKILWANLHLLFWLSLIPFGTAWNGERELSTVPTAFYGVILFFCGAAYKILQTIIIASEGRQSRLALAIGSDWKGWVSPVLYALAIGLAFVSPWIADAIYVLVALIWLVPDRRIEARFAGTAHEE
jgi:uncharacterized membrane protein